MDIRPGDLIPPPAVLTYSNDNESGRYASCWNAICYRPQGNDFTPVCQSFRSQGGLPQYMLGYNPPWADTPPRADTPLGRHPPRADTTPLGRHPPWADTPSPWADTPQQTAPAADGTHPSGMNSCFVLFLSNLCMFIIFNQKC